MLPLVLYRILHGTMSDLRQHIRCFHLIVVQLYAFMTVTRPYSMDAPGTLEHVFSNFWLVSRRLHSNGERFHGP